MQKLDPFGEGNFIGMNPLPDIQIGNINIDMLWNLGDKAFQMEGSSLLFQNTPFFNPF